MIALNLKKYLLILMILSSSSVGIAAKRLKRQSMKQMITQIVTIGPLLYQQAYSQHFESHLFLKDVEQAHPSPLHSASHSEAVYDDAYSKRFSLKHEYGGDDAVVSWDSDTWQDYKNWESMGSYSGYYKDLYLGLIEPGYVSNYLFLQGIGLTRPYLSSNCFSCGLSLQGKDQQPSTNIFQSLCQKRLSRSCNP